MFPAHSFRNALSRWTLDERAAQRVLCPGLASEGLSLVTVLVGCE